VPSEDDPDPWGPIFDLDVVFLEHVTSSLCGQADFFANFGISFERPQFTLTY
jgi:hypothetical protein